MVVLIIMLLSTPPRLRTARACPVVPQRRGLSDEDDVANRNLAAAAKGRGGGVICEEVGMLVLGRVTRIDFLGAIGFPKMHSNRWKREDVLGSVRHYYYYYYYYCCH